MSQKSSQKLGFIFLMFVFIHHSSVQSQNLDSQSIDLVEPQDLNDDQSLAQNTYKLTLEDAVYLALQQNQDLKITYLNRLLQQQSLAESEGIFNPIFTPEISISRSLNQSGSTLTRNQEAGISTNLKFPLPTGGSLNLTWQGRHQLSLEPTNNAIQNQNFSIGFQQPLIQGFGTSLNRLSIERARLTETENELSFRLAIANTITSTIEAYRNLLLAQSTLQNEQLSLDNSRQDLARQNALYNFGRISRNSLVERQANIAQQEFDLIATQGRLQQAIADLADLLNIPTNQTLIAIEQPTPPTSLDLPPFEELLALTLANSSEYLSAKNATKNAEFNLIEAQDQQKWNLNLNVDYGLADNSAIEDSYDLSAKLNLNRQFGNVSLANAVNKSETNITIANYSLEQIQQNIERDLVSRLRDLQDSFRSIQLASETEQLAETKLQNTRKQMQSRNSSFSTTDIINFEQELVNAKNQKLAAIITHLNQITRLEQTLGLTLGTWQVDPLANTVITESKE